MESSMKLHFSSNFPPCACTLSRDSRILSSFYFSRSWKKSFLKLRSWCDLSIKLNRSISVSGSKLCEPSLEVSAVSAVNRPSIVDRSGFSAASIRSIIARIITVGWFNSHGRVEFSVDNKKHTRGVTDPEDGGKSCSNSESLDIELLYWPVDLLFAEPTLWKPSWRYLSIH